MKMLELSKSVYSRSLLRESYSIEAVIHELRYHLLRCRAESVRSLIGECTRTMYATLRIPNIITAYHEITSAKDIG
jgi:hypothetical protein